MSERYQTVDSESREINKSHSNTRIQGAPKTVYFAAALIVLVSFLCVVFLTAILVWILSMQQGPVTPSSSFHIQGHRGCRALMPENTLISFLTALPFGVRTLELDVVISKDREVVVSHDPFLNFEICSSPSGANISSLAESRKVYRIYNLTYSEISRADCGSHGNRLFPRQLKVAASKPLLSQVFDAVERATVNHEKLFYNIEIKSKPANDRIFHPEVDDFAHLVYDVIMSRPHVKQQVIIQSFDNRSLEAIHKIDPSIPLSLLVPLDNQQVDYVTAVESLGFKLTFFSPRFDLVTQEMSDYMKKNNIQLLPWTVNTEAEMLRMKALGATGLITDEIDVAMQLRKDGKL